MQCPSRRFLMYPIKTSHSSWLLRVAFHSQKIPYTSGKNLSAFKENPSKMRKNPFVQISYPFWMSEMPFILLYFCLGCKHWNSIVTVTSSWFPLFFKQKCYHAYYWEHGKFLFSIIWCYSSSVVIGRHKIQRTISWRPGVCGMVQWSNGPEGPVDRTCPNLFRLLLLQVLLK